jgi:hypothetical protein
LNSIQNNKDVTRQKHCLQTESHTKYQNIKITGFLETGRKIVTQNAGPLIPRCTGEALQFFRQVRKSSFLTKIVLHPDGHQKVTAFFCDFKTLGRFSLNHKNLPVFDTS